VTTPRLLKVSEVHGWTLIRRSVDGRPDDWLMTPSHGVDGPVLVFATVDAATVYAQRHEPDQARHG